jgi:predicted HTH domain antitoxin
VVNQPGCFVQYRSLCGEDAQRDLLRQPAILGEPSPHAPVQVVFLPLQGQREEVVGYYQPCANQVAAKNSNCRSTSTGTRYNGVMQTVTLQLPEGIAAKLAASSSDTAARVKVELALNLYSLGEITHAEACQLAGMSRMDFESLLAEREVVRPYTIEMLAEDVKNAGRR